MRLIDADALKEEVNKKKVVGRFNTLLLIDNAPTVELNESVIQEVLNKRCMTAVANEYLITLHGQQPQGEWIRRKMNWYICSNCNYKTDSIGETFFNFCPNCGADMKGGAE